MAEGVRKLKIIEGEFVKTLRKLREEIEKLEREKASLFEGIEDLKARGEEKANKLRYEVETLRKEVEALKETISGPKKDNNHNSRTHVAQKRKESSL